MRKTAKKRLGDQSWITQDLSSREPVEGGRYATGTSGRAGSRGQNAEGARTERNASGRVSVGKLLTEKVGQDGDPWWPSSLFLNCNIGRFLTRWRDFKGGARMSQAQDIGNPPMAPAEVAGGTERLP